MAYTVIGRIRPCPLGAWSAERAYETLDVVMSVGEGVDPANLAPVPENYQIALENAAYWAPIVDVSAAVDAAKEATDAARQAAVEVKEDVNQLKDEVLSYGLTVEDGKLCVRTEE